MTAIEKIRFKIEGEVFDYIQLMDALKDYKKPRDIVSALLKKSSIIRIRKGLYIFGEFWKRKSISKEVLSGLVYGPSVISLDFALAYYGLIPEHINTLTAITSKRSRVFNTPVGNFSYTQQKAHRLSFGYRLHTDSIGSFLMAEPLKALADKVWADKRFKPTSPASFQEYLFDDLRIDENTLSKFIILDDLKALEIIYASRKISWLVKYLNKKYKTV